MVFRSDHCKFVMIRKTPKYGRIADENTLQFVPAIFSLTGQIHNTFEFPIKEQISQKLICFEGRAIRQPLQINDEVVV